MGPGLVQFPYHQRSGCDLGARDFWDLSARVVFHPCVYTGSLGVYAHGIQPEDLQAHESAAARDHVHFFDFHDVTANQDSVAAGFHD